MTTSTYTVNDIVEFVNGQKDNRITDPRSSQAEDIGSVLVHYARKKLKRKITTIGLSKVGTAHTFLVPDNQLTESFIRSFQATMSAGNSPLTYKDVKKVLTQNTVVNYFVLSAAEL